MKTVLSLVLAITLSNAQGSEITNPPDGVLQKIDEIQDLINTYRIYNQDEPSLGRFIQVFRQMTPIIYMDNFNYTFNTHLQAIARLGSADADFRSKISAENPNSCFDNLLTSLSNAVEYSGYFISDCIDINDPSIFTKTKTFLKDIEESDKIARALPIIPFKALIGRNVFTKPDEIIARLQELYDIEFSNDKEVLERLLDEINIFALGWNSESFGIEACLKGIDASVKNAVEAIEARIPSCRSYGGYKPRSSIVPIDITQFFPKRK